MKKPWQGKLFVGTSNEGKIREFREVFAGSGIEIEPVGIKFHELQIEDIREISRDKAIQAFNILKSPVVVDDVGIYIDKYQNFPGVNTKQIVSNLGVGGIKRLIDEGDRAHFLAVLSYLDESLDTPLTFSDETAGKLSLKFKGNGESGFPFNQLFIPDDEVKFVCQVSIKERIRFSHRMKAATKLREYLLNKG